MRPEEYPSSRTAQDGFSMVEILVAISIFAIVAVGLVQGLGLSGELVGRARVDTVAVNLASAEIERARGLAYRDVGTYISAEVAGNPPGVIARTRTERLDDIDYRIRASVRYVDDPAPGQAQTRVDYKEVTIVVTPQAHGAEAVTLSTLVAPPATGSVAGSVTVIPRVLDVFTGEAVAAADVTVAGAVSPPRGDLTDARGETVFADLPAGAENPADPAYHHRVSVAAEGYLPTVASGPDVVRQHLTGGQTWSPTLSVFRPATIVVGVRDRLTGAPVTQPTDVQVAAPGSASLVGRQSGTGGTYTFTEIAGRPIEPSRSAFTVTVNADCHRGTVLQSPVPEGYPATLTQAFDARLEPFPVTGTLRVRAVDAASRLAIPGARIQVSGGTPAIVPWERTTDASGTAQFCLGVTALDDYVAQATAPGYGLASLRAPVQLTATGGVELRLVAGVTGDLRLVTAPGRLVRVRAAAGTLDVQEVADASGQVVVRGLAAGAYTVDTSADGVTWSGARPGTVVGGQLVSVVLG
jgi:prepilin-type N-terminal cleavage/methylation domain-containing protein